jgi:hypothetical protein
VKHEAPSCRDTVTSHEEHYEQQISTSQIHKRIQPANHHRLRCFLLGSLVPSPSRFCLKPFQKAWSSKKYNHQYYTLTVDPALFGRDRDSGRDREFSGDSIRPDSFVGHL